MQTALVPDNQSSTIVEPGEATLDAPSFAITGCRKSRRRAAFSPPPIFSCRNTGLDAAPGKFAPESSAVKTFVGNQFLHPGSRPPASLLFDRDGGQRPTRQADFVRLCAVAVKADRQTITIGDQHHFRAFPDLGAADSIAPFFDGTKDPSKKAAAHSILPSRSSIESKVRQIWSHTPAADHSSKRRQQVEGEPYSGGRSAHGMPVFKTYRMPFRHLRLSVRGRPGPFFDDGSSGSSTCHCASVKSCRLIQPYILTQLL